MIRRNFIVSHSCCKTTPSDEQCYEVFFPEYLIHEAAQVVLLVVVDRNENHAVVGKQVLEQVEARPHHAEPLVVAFQVFVIDRPFSRSHSFMSGLFTLSL